MVKTRGGGVGSWWEFNQWLDAVNAGVTGCNLMYAIDCEFFITSLFTNFSAHRYNIANLTIQPQSLIILQMKHSIIFMMI
jgi:hypothetical protein